MKWKGKEAEKNESWDLYYSCLGSLDFRRKRREREKEEEECQQDQSIKKMKE